MSAFARYDASVAFLRDLDNDWAGLVAHVEPSAHPLRPYRGNPSNRDIHGLLLRGSALPFEADIRAANNRRPGGVSERHRLRI
jgi:hypothetical protein